jgi:hypothetical protein
MAALAAALALAVERQCRQSSVRACTGHALLFSHPFVAAAAGQVQSPNQPGSDELTGVFPSYFEPRTIGFPLLLPPRQAREAIFHAGMIRKIRQFRQIRTSFCAICESTPYDYFIRTQL